ncbi:hypothetical protein [Streptomyces pimonensis]|uniref:hypothetical protein n=1 Tax=Streptomyces pimonensis TaxID=2860288 RepID=UPI0035272DE1
MDAGGLDPVTVRPPPEQRCRVLHRVELSLVVGEQAMDVVPETDEKPGSFSADSGAFRSLRVGLDTYRSTGRAAYPDQWLSRGRRQGRLAPTPLRGAAPGTPRRRSHGLRSRARPPMVRCGAPGR